MDEMLPIGKRVVIYPFDEKRLIQGTNITTTGTIIENSSYEIYNYEDLPWYIRQDALEIEGPFFVRLYRVLGEDGKEYFGALNNGVKGDSYFETFEKSIVKMKKRIDSINDVINELEEEKIKVLDFLNQLRQESFKEEPSDNPLSLTK